MLFCSTALFAQSNRRVSGFVVDTSKTAIIDAQIVLIAGSDTLRATSNTEGYFNFSKIKAETFSLKISLMGYQSYSSSHTFGKEKQLEIKPIVLRQEINMLQAVEIKAKPNPMRIMRDTIEYNAAAFQVLEGDNVADLIKQFPGMEVDEDYNVKAMGKDMVKLRVNGKDFFTNNIQEFIGKLPAAIVSKIQVIDDFGDEANFTGIKIGEPKKMLNIVTKPGMNKGRFGNGGINAGTNDQLGISGIMNFWNGSKQNGGTLVAGTSNNGAGTSQRINLSSNHRGQVGKYATGGIGYSYRSNDAASKNEQATETFHPMGTFFTKSLSNGENESSNYSLSSTLNYNNKKVYIDAHIDGSYNEANNLNASFNDQSGVFRQDVKNKSESTNRSPSINGRFNLSKKLKKNSFSINFGFTTNATNSNQNISTNTLYYDKDTQILKKDSLLNRNLIAESNSQNINFGASFSVGLKKPKDTLARRSLNFTHSSSIGRSSNDVSTFVFNNISKIPYYVDSLSSRYTSVVINQSLGVNYNYSDKKIRYNLGFNVRPNLMMNNYINLNKKINNNSFNYSPNLNVSKTLAVGKVLLVNYIGNNNSPSLYQLQPIRNNQNLQNIIIGNPDLKPSFSHNINSIFNYVDVKTGRSAQIGLNVSTTQDEIVNNMILLPDTLNSLKQETRFENTNGTYTIGSNYFISFPIEKNKYTISYGGGLGHSNKAIFVNSMKRFNKGINFSQQLRASILLKKVSLNASANYSFSSNLNMMDFITINDVSLFNIGQIDGATLLSTHTYRADISSSLRLKNFILSSAISYNLSQNNANSTNNSIKNIEGLNLSLSAKATLRKTYQIGFSSVKQFNNGYSLSNTNPLLLNVSLSKSLLKDQTLSFNINANDLLNQGNNLTRSVSGNSVIDRRTNQITRVFTFGIRYSLNKFGGRAFNVNVD